MQLVRPIGSLLILGMLGCGGEAATKSFVKPYGTLHGAISANTPIHAKNVRVALAWYRVVSPDPNNPDGAHVVMQTQDVPVSSTFPTNFTLDITQLPPAEAMRDFTPDEITRYGLDPTNRYARAVLLVYEDLNGNEKLDFTDAQASGLTDKLLGHLGDTKGNATSNYLIWYWEGPPPPAALWDGELVGCKTGFNLGYDEHDGQPGVVKPSTFVPLDTPLSVKLKGDPKLSCYLVEPRPAAPLGNGLDVAFLPEVHECVDNKPYPNDEPLCFPGLGMYVSSLASKPSPAIEKLCGDVAKECFVLADPNNPDGPLTNPPADWPCTTP